MKFEIKYYLNETSFNQDIAAYKEVILGTREYVINWAKTNMRRNSNFKFYSINEL